MLRNLVKAAAAVALSPVALVADICTLPASAYDNKGPFDRTGALLAAAGRNVAQAVKPETDNA